MKIDTPSEVIELLHKQQDMLAQQQAVIVQQAQLISELTKSTMK